MEYLNEECIKKIGINWKETIDVIEEAVKCLKKGDFAQPIKPYLRYRDLKNRIIAMPAFLGGNFNIAGIKWISSFPDNIKKGIPRAHSVVILNNADTGEPVAIFNTALISIIRTASVSGLIIKHYSKIKNLDKIKIGIIGWGPIGQYHLNMCNEILGNKIEKVFLFDLREVDKNLAAESIRQKIVVTESWQDAYSQADIFITCTVSKAPYIDKIPKKGSLHLNVSLRDYKPEMYDFFKETIIVDDWNEVCRENTDIENMSKIKGLKQQDTYSIIDVINDNCLTKIKNDQSVMFSPMGMAVFDMAIANYYFTLLS